MPRTLFVDFLYAIVVAIGMSRITVDILSWSSVELWGILFLLGVFLEDFYVYHKEVAPFLREGGPGLKSLFLEVSIVLSWYVSQTAFPKKLRAFTVFLAVFYALKIAGAIKMTDRLYAAERDTSYLLPVIAGVTMALLNLSVTATLMVMATSCCAASMLRWVFLPLSSSRLKDKVNFN